MELPTSSALLGPFKYVVVFGAVIVAIVVLTLVLGFRSDRVKILQEPYMTYRICRDTFVVDAVIKSVKVSVCHDTLVLRLGFEGVKKP